MNSGIREALVAVEGADSKEVDAIGLALSMILRDQTRQFVEEWLDAPAPAFEGETARTLIKAGRGGEVAQALWGLVDGVAT